MNYYIYSITIILLMYPTSYEHPEFFNIILEVKDLLRLFILRRVFYLLDCLISCLMKTA